MGGWPGGGGRARGTRPPVRFAGRRRGEQEVSVGRLDGKGAVVTGAGRGIGRATALRLASEGAAVVVNDVDPEPAEETAQEIKNHGGRAQVSTHDTVELEQARRMMEAAAGELGQIDILVNNAGITRDK